MTLRIANHYEYTNKIKVSLLSFSLLFVFGIVALAQEIPPVEVIEAVNLDEDIQPEDLGIGEPRLLPDSPFYFLKEWGRNIQSFFTFDPVKKVELIEKFANEKLIELKKTVEQKRTRERIEKAVENYQNEVEEAKRLTERIRVRAEESEEVEKFLDKFIRHQALHQRVLQKLEEQVPAESFEKIKEARERHLEKFGEVMTKLENRTEELREKLEKNLEEIKGSEFKNFKNLEVLKELEEKVPEEAKEAIQKAGENILKRLQGDLEKMSPEDQEKFKGYLEKVSGEKERHVEILENLKGELIKTPKLQQKIIESKDNILEKIKIKETKEPQVCITLWDPVCGKDGKTYSNECFTKVAGVDIEHKGVCKEEVEP